MPWNSVTFETFLDTKKKRESCNGAIFRAMHNETGGKFRNLFVPTHCTVIGKLVCELISQPADNFTAQSRTWNMKEAVLVRLHRRRAIYVRTRNAGHGICEIKIGLAESFSGRKTKLRLKQIITRANFFFPRRKLVFKSNERERQNTGKHFYRSNKMDRFFPLFFPGQIFSLCTAMCLFSKLAM